MGKFFVSDEVVCCRRISAGEYLFAEVLETLLTRENIDLGDRHNYTPVHQAVTRSFLFSLRELIRLGADINKKSYGGFTPLMLAIQQDRVEEAKLLLEAGANPFIADDDDDNAFTVAGSEAHPEVRKLLSDWLYRKAIDKKLGISDAE